VDSIKRQFVLQIMGIEPWQLRKTQAPAMKIDIPAQPVEQLDWTALETAVRDCQRCPLYKTRTQPVFGVGNRQAHLMVIGEAPGANEDKQGEPFVGRGGQLLNAMLHAIGLKREDIYIANILKSRPPNNRDPQPAEVAACTPFLLRQITLIKPKVMLAVGRIAAQYLLNTTQAMSKLRGQHFEYGPLKTPLIVSYHPAYLLRSPREKKKAWQDMQFLNQLLQDFPSANK
jgi:uracil-DNA glycosylase